MDLKAVVDASFFELSDHFISGPADAADPVAESYAHLLYLFQKGELEQFQLDSSQMGEKEYSLLSSLHRIFYRLHNQALEQNDAQEMMGLVEWMGDNPLWKAELQYTAGLVFWSIEDRTAASHFFLQAKKALDALGLYKKGLRSLCFRVQCLEEMNQCPHPENEYNYVVNKAKLLNDPVMEGIANLQLARLYHCERSYQAAIKHVDMARELLQQDLSSLFSYMAEIHKAFLLFATGEREAAEQSRQKVTLAPFPTIRQAAKCLQKIIQQDISHLDYQTRSNAVPLWNHMMVIEDSLEPLQGVRKYSRLEKKLIDELVKKPCARRELMQKIYGIEVPKSVSENRLKNLLNRFRKKYPETVVMKNGRYQINDMVL